MNRSEYSEYVPGWYLQQVRGECGAQCGVGVQTALHQLVPRQQGAAALVAQHHRQGVFHTHLHTASHYYTPYSTTSNAVKQDT